jgi:hypothetical protein
MITDLYQEYLYIIGKLKDVYKLDSDTTHRNIHTFYQNKAQIFKLMFGKYTNGGNQIVVSFHIDVPSRDAVYWFLNIQYFYPLLKVVDHHIEDDKGETYLGSDATAIQNLLIQRNTLDHWLSNKTDQEIKDFTEGDVVGSVRNSKQSYNSQEESGKAIIEFERMKKPSDGEDTH